MLLLVHAVLLLRRTAVLLFRIAWYTMALEVVRTGTYWNIPEHTTMNGNVSTVSLLISMTQWFLQSEQIGTMPCFTWYLV